MRVGGEHGGRQGAVRGQRLVRVQVLVMTVTQAVRVRAQPEVTQAPEAERGVAEAGAEHVHGLQNKNARYEVFLDHLVLLFCLLKIM